MEDDEKDLLIVGGLAAGLYFAVLRPILRNLGIDDGSKEKIQALQDSDPSENPFSYQFQPFVDKYQPYYDANANGDPATYWVGMKQNMLNQYGYSLIGNPLVLGTQYDIAVLAEALYSTISFWKEPDVTDINNIFAGVPNQITVAGMDAYLQFNYNTDLITFLQGGKRYILFLQWGLKDTDLAAIIDKVNSLPVQ